MRNQEYHCCESTIWYYLINLVIYFANTYIKPSRLLSRHHPHNALIPPLDLYKYLRSSELVPISMTWLVQVQASQLLLQPQSLPPPFIMTRIISILSIMSWWIYIWPDRYSITVKDSHLCTSISTSKVTQPDALEATAVVVPITCFGSNDGNIFSFFFLLGKYVILVLAFDHAYKLQSVLMVELLHITIKLTQLSNRTCFFQVFLGEIRISMSLITTAVFSTSTERFWRLKV